jgi:hypothetical protein
MNRDMNTNTNTNMNRDMNGEDALSVAYSSYHFNAFNFERSKAQIEKGIKVILKLEIRQSCF